MPKIATKLVADQFVYNILVFSIICIQYNIKNLFLFVRSANITFVYGAKIILVTEQKLFSYHAIIFLIFSKNLFLSSKNSFYIEQKSMSYRAFNSHPYTYQQLMILFRDLR